MPSKLLILFDIDGTLLSVDSRNMRNLIAEMFRDQGLSDEDHSSISFAGRTDRAIFRDLIGPRKEDPELFDRIKRAYLEKLAGNLSPDWITVHEGVQESVEWCQREGIAYGLLTGNFEEAAFIKLRAAGIASYFDFGAFGCEHTDRNMLPGLALQNARSRFGKHFHASDAVIIGDTPNDIRCAQYAGSVSVAVTTGPFDEKQLEKHKPDFLTNSLSSVPDYISSLM